MRPSRRSGSARPASSSRIGRRSCSSMSRPGSLRPKARRRAPGRERRRATATATPRARRSELPIAAVYSADELLRERDFARFGPDELRRARALVERIATRVAPPPVAAQPPSHDGRTLDLRRTLHQAMRTGGHPIERAWRTPKTVPRRLIFLVDVSGSMEPYARAMTMFLQAAVRAGRHVEAFTFGTRLTRLTPLPGGPRPRSRARARRGGRARLGRRHAHRREPEGLQRRLGSPRADAGRRRRDRLRRLGARRPAAARQRDGPPAACRAHRRLDQPARGRRGLPPARRRAWPRRFRTSISSCPGTT